MSEYRPFTMAVKVSSAAYTDMLWMAQNEEFRWRDMQASEMRAVTRAVVEGWPYSKIEDSPRAKRARFWREVRDRITGAWRVLRYGE